MPGPMSVPAGTKSNINTYDQRDPNKRIYTGKTDQKHGRILNAKNEGEINRSKIQRVLSRARREQQEAE
jgi:hypothetical protein